MVSQCVRDTTLRCLLITSSIVIIFGSVLMVRLLSSGINLHSLKINGKGLKLRTDNHAISINGKGISVLPRRRSCELGDCEKADNNVAYDEEEEEDGEVPIVYRNYGTIQYDIQHNMGTVDISKYINYGDIHVHLYGNRGKVRIRIYNGDGKGRVFIYCELNFGHIEIFKDEKGTTELKTISTNVGRISEEDLEADERFKGKHTWTEKKFLATQTIHDHRNVGHRDL